MSNNAEYGTLTVTPVNGITVSKVEIVYSGNQYYEDNPTIPSTTSYAISGATGTWTVNSDSPVTMTFSTNGDSGKRIYSIRVYYAATTN